MPTQQTPITTYVSDELAERLRKRAAEERLSISQFLRRYLEKQFKIAPIQMPRRGRPPKEQSEADERSA